MEVVSVVGVALLSATFEWLLWKLDSIGSLNLQEQVHAELQNWKNFMPQIRDVIEAAEEKQITSRSVKRWLSELRDLAYDMEDILDEFGVDSLRSNLSMKPQANTNKVSKSIPTCFFGSRQRDAKSDLETVSRIKDISSRLQGIVAERSALGLSLSMNAGDRSKRRVAERVPTTSLPVYHLYGREVDIEVILQKLLTAESDHDGVPVIPIVGIGGVGKTTLVQQVHSDERLKGRFELKVWVYVSDEFDVLQITRTILQAVAGENCDLKDLNLLQKRLKERLPGKKFLLVLDDAWNENHDYWDILRRPLMLGECGSKIIATTRNNGVALTMGRKNLIRRVKGLQDDECLSLFATHALGADNFDAHPNLEGIGEEIVKKCKGLPLAAKALGSLLRGKLSSFEWQDILNSEMWDLPEDKSGILPALRLSYHHLPSYLKQCFAFCAIFPKGCEFDKDELVLLWMAEGFLQQRQKGMKQMEDVSYQCFHDLLSRAFFQQSNRDKSWFVIHDLIHDLAQYVAGEIFYNLDHIFKREMLEMGFEKVRRFSFYQRICDKFDRFCILDKLNSLRTFLALYPFDRHIGCYISNSVLPNFMPKLTNLRVLPLSGYCIKSCQNQLGI